MPGDNDNIRAYVRAKHGVEEVRKETAKRKRDASAAVKGTSIPGDGWRGGAPRLGFFFVFRMESLRARAQRLAHDSIDFLPAKLLYL